jgi:hypothetical protein
MKTHKTRVSNSPGKLRLLETCQHEFREKLNIRHACYIIIAELSYETQYKTWLRPPLRDIRTALGASPGITEGGTQNRASSIRHGPSIMHLLSPHIVQH